MAVVIDPSMALAWLLPDETSASAELLRAAIENGEQAWIPAHWWLEVGNGLLVAERRRRLDSIQVAGALSLMASLPLEEDGESAQRLLGQTFDLARKHGLTIYDAAYLELAQRRQATLATLDEQLIKAAKKEGVPTELS